MATGKIFNAMDHLMRGVVTAGEAIGKIGGDAISKVGIPMFKGGVVGANAGIEGGKAVKGVLTSNASKEFGKKVGRAGAHAGAGIAQEIGTEARALGNLIGGAIDGVETKGFNKFMHNMTGNEKHLGKKRGALLKKDDHSLLGYKTNAVGTGLIMGGAAISGIGPAAKDWNDKRSGQNDGMMHTSTPFNSNASYQSAYKDNAGATGDLVFALNNMRHGGMM